MIETMEGGMPRSGVIEYQPTQDQQLQRCFEYFQESGLMGLSELRLNQLYEAGYISFDAFNQEMEERAAFYGLKDPLPVAVLA